MIRFVSGTDTGIGKTVVSAVLARRSLEQGMSVRYVKPLQTGGDDDAAVVRSAGIDARTLLRFPDPLAPAVAAELSGTTIDFDGLVRDTRACGDGVDVLYVEGAGGLLVPITEKHTMADFAEALDAELIVVARPGLGTLNHTALTIEAAERRGLHVATIVVSDYTGGRTEETNLVQLRELGPPIEVLERIADRH
ncbi:MAG TPA: dethiobiotin synthase [Actinomycetota bacterium]|jgi:dethiobiotin synthetase|nr:dethiobiotin synthase [Actinomycetota bacterium]